MTPRATVLALPALLLVGCTLDWNRTWRDAGPPDAGPPPPTWVTVPSGRYLMGSRADEPCRLATESPQPVIVSRRFELLGTETLRSDFKRLMGYDPSRSGCAGEACPVDNVSWHEAAAYCNALSRSNKLAACYSCTGAGAAVACVTAADFAKSIHECPGHRLPTDAEWEHACRAGTSSAFYDGAVTSCDGTDPVAERIGWYLANSGGDAHPAGQKLANAWRLADMSGNLLEWCHDDRFDSAGADVSVDPVGLTLEPGPRAARGGSYLDPPGALRAASGRLLPRNFHSGELGFRCARTAPVAQQSVLNAVLLPTEAGQYALDLDGSGPKNQLGGLIALAIQLKVNVTLTPTLLQGKLLILFELFGTSPTDQQDAVMQVYLGQDPDRDPRNNFSGSAPLAISETASYDSVVKGTLDGGKLVATGDQLLLPLPVSFVTGDPVVLRRARVEAKVTPDGLSGVAGGAITVADFENKVLPGVAAEFNRLIDPGNKDISEDQKSFIRKALDPNGDGTITGDEVRRSIFLHQVAPDVDISGTGALDGYSLAAGFTTVTCQIVRSSP